MADVFRGVACLVGLLGITAQAARARASQPLFDRDMRVGVTRVATPARRSQAPAEPQVVFLNFSNGTESITRAEVDDATQNRSSIGAASPFPAFTWPSLVDGTFSRMALVRLIARRVHEFFLPYNVLITTIRPITGPYTMVMIGGVSADIGVEERLGGVAFLDCGNVQASNLVYAFPPSVAGNFQALVVAIAHETAHAFGLEHSTNPRDLMFPRADPAQEAFTDVDSPLDGEHFCGSPSQNSHRRLLELVGPWTGDVKPLEDGSGQDRSPPRLAFLEPGPGAVVQQPFLVRVAADDEGGIERVMLQTGTERQTQWRPPYAWSLSGLVPGPTTLYVIAHDESGNVATSTLDLVVGAPPSDAGGCAAAAGPRAQSINRPGLVPILLGLAAVACVGRRRRL